jgi:hypothetical protein
MRAIRTFAFAAAICTLAACTGNPTLPASAGTHGASRDNGGLIGTGNINSATTTTVTPCPDENGGLIGSGNNTGTPTCDNGGLIGTGN